MRKLLAYLLIAIITAAAAAGGRAEPRTQGRVSVLAGGFVPVHFPASDGVQLRGEVIGAGRVGIVIAHDADANFSEWEPAAKFLGSHG